MWKGHFSHIQIILNVLRFIHVVNHFGEFSGLFMKNPQLVEPKTLAKLTGLYNVIYDRHTVIQVTIVRHLEFWEKFSKNYIKLDQRVNS